MLAFARHVMLPIFFAEVSQSPNYDFEQHIFLSSLDQREFEWQLVSIGIGTFKDFLPTYHHVSPTPKSSNIGPIQLGLHDELIQVWCWFNKWPPPPWPVPVPPERFLRWLLRPKGEVTPPAKVGSKTMGNQQKKHWNCFFWSTWSTFIDFPGVFWALQWLEVIRNDVFCFLYSNLTLFNLGCCFHSRISCLNLALNILEICWMLIFSCYFLRAKSTSP